MRGRRFLLCMEGSSCCAWRDVPCCAWWDIASLHRGMPTSRLSMPHSVAPRVHLAVSSLLTVERSSTDCQRSDGDGPWGSSMGKRVGERRRMILCAESSLHVRQFPSRASMLSYNI